MGLDLQKASVWKRVSAYLFDIIILGILAVGIAFVLSEALGYDTYNQTVNDAYDRYEAEYDIKFEITAEEYAAMSEEELARYDQAYEALIADEPAMYAYNMVVNLTLLVMSLSILIACIGLEFVVPLLFGDGRTLGKKIFGICVMRVDGVRVTPVQLFVRTILGKYTVETMIPALILVMLFFNTVGLTGTIVIGLILILQMVLIAATKTNSAIHDLMSGTVVVDYHSQRIFNSSEELLEYKKARAAEQAARRDY